MTTANRMERRYRKAIEALFLKKDAPAPPGPLHQHLKVCPACRQLYMSLALAERQLGQSAGVNMAISPFEEDMVWKNIAPQLSGQAATEKKRFIPARLWLATTAFLFLLLVGSVVLWRVKSGGNVDENGFGSRGKPTTADLQLHCITSGDEPVVVSSERPVAKTRCRLQQYLGFSYLNPQGRYQGLAMFALDEKGENLPYLPNPSQPEAVALADADSPKALGRTIQLSINHHAGEYQVVAVFLPQPITYDQMLQLAQVLQKEPSSVSGKVIRLSLTVEE